MFVYLYTFIHSCMYLYSIYAHKRMGCSPAHQQSFRVCVCMCVHTCKRRACEYMYIPMSSPPPRSWPCPYILGVRPRALRSNPQRLPTATPNGLLPKGAFSLPRHGTEGVSSGTDCTAWLFARPALRWWVKLPGTAAGARSSLQQPLKAAAFQGGRGSTHSRHSRRVSPTL